MLQAVPLRRDLITAQGGQRAGRTSAPRGDPSGRRKRDKPDYWERLIRAKERLVFIDQQIGDQEVAEARMSSSQVLDEAAPPRSRLAGRSDQLGAACWPGCSSGSVRRRPGADLGQAVAPAGTSRGHSAPGSG